MEDCLLNRFSDKDQFSGFFIVANRNEKTFSGPVSSISSHRISALIDKDIALKLSSNEFIFGILKGPHIQDTMFSGSILKAREVDLSCCKALSIEISLQYPIYSVGEEWTA
ncbi:hypothetical protein LEP1GSC050_0669 [Leptospira broomii serovar Hurstbridge str. 5399]|uniref:Uncharacterized protein n=1 Tax=Leptospira broomii serovar Hurstbridge str. 5399 TaxID=1049789 RepID=T0FGY7_9LEPT|nr:hypothetical protein LEP1GSC050_0669 [Leptospira broomii serovar Hurstbridge str. 5399]